jgi:hypothetical protein
VRYSQNVIRNPFLSLLVAAALPSCVVYSDGLFDDENTGGTSSGGGTGSGTASGGTPGSGGTGTGSDSSGGAPSGGSGTGSDTTGGSNTGGTGTGGSAGALVDDFSGKAATYENSPFAGEWQRTGQTKPAITWTAANVSAMIQEIPDDTGNWAMHVEADAPNPNGAPSDEWGGEVFASLVDSPTGTLSLASYTHVAFRARAIDENTLTLKVMLEDEASTFALCSVTPPCPAHASRTASLTIPANGWTNIKISLSTFMRASPAFDLTKVHGIHFQMDPAMTNSAIDFWIDDIRFLTE